jgi:hypothetical protein
VLPRRAARLNRALCHYWAFRSISEWLQDFRDKGDQASDTLQTAGVWGRWWCVMCMVQAVSWILCVLYSLVNSAVRV